MKTKNLILISTLSVIVLLIILIGTNTIKFSFYKSEVSNSISSTWNNSKSIGRYNDSNEEISFPTVPIIVVYKSKKVGDTNSQNPMQIDISDKNFGLIWLPLVKKSDYNFSVTCKDAHEIKTDSVIGQFIVNGEIKVSGHYKFIGSYSTQAATDIVVDKVLTDIYNEIRKNIK
jgi:hypothetical protein